MTSTGSLSVGTLDLLALSSLTGTGTVTGNVINAGLVNSGSPPGLLTITGNYTQTAAGTLEFTLNSTQYSQLAVKGNATFGGTLSVSLGSASPTVGAEYPAVMTFTSATGSFANTSGLQLGNNVEIDPSANATTLTLAIECAAGPAIEDVTPSGAVNTAVSAIDVTFSKLINLSTFTASQITLTGPDGSITVQNPVLLSGDTYQIAFASQLAQGTYTLQIAAGVKDLIGNASSQPFSDSFVIRLSDLVASSISINGSDSATFGQSVPVSWAVTNSGAGTASPAWTDEIWLSQTPTLTNSAILLLSQPETAFTPLGVWVAIHREHFSDLALERDDNAGNLLFAAGDERHQYGGRDEHDEQRGCQRRFDLEPSPCARSGRYGRLSASLRI